MKQYMQMTWHFFILQSMPVQLRYSSVLGCVEFVALSEIKSIKRGWGSEVLKMSRKCFVIVCVRMSVCVFVCTSLYVSSCVIEQSPCSL